MHESSPSTCLPAWVKKGHVKGRAFCLLQALQTPAQHVCLSVFSVPRPTGVQTMALLTAGSQGAAEEAEAWLGGLLLGGRVGSGVAPFARLAGSPAVAGDITQQATR